MHDCGVVREVYVHRMRPWKWRPRQQLSPMTTRMSWQGPPCLLLLEKQWLLCMQVVQTDCIFQLLHQEKQQQQQRQRRQQYQQREDSAAAQRGQGLCEGLLLLLLLHQMQQQQQQKAVCLRQSTLSIA